MNFWALSLFAALFLAACSPGAPADEAEAPGVTAPAADLSPPVAPVTGAPDAAGEPGVTFGRNEDGTFYHGEADAPVTFIDYSDFL